MKLYRFTAADNHRAILKVHDALGADALVYSTRKTKNGIEVLAGLGNEQEPENAKIDVKNAESQHQLIESLANQLQVMDATIQRLAGDVTTLNKFIHEKMNKPKTISKTLSRVRNFFKVGVYGRHATQQQ